MLNNNFTLTRRPMEQSCWIPDVLAGFEQCTLSGFTAPDGPAACVLVRKRCASPSAKAVLYIHGYVDYFFQTHLADFYNQNGLHFYALDLRRHGRAMQLHQLPNYTSDIDEYLQDIDAAVPVLLGPENINWLLLSGHSTGGLVAALYAHRAAHRSALDAVLLNSPFLDMNLSAWQRRTLVPLLSAVGAWLPRLPLPIVTVVYGQSLHADHHGQWRYNTQWKPIAGFPVYAGWLRAIHRAHAEVAGGLSIQCPVLVLHAQRSTRLAHWSTDAMCADTVLDVADIQRLSPALGPRIQVRAITGGMHDLTLSQAGPRAQAFSVLRQWLKELAG
ncbi:MAG: alpha/beta hydrolase [Rhodoferax sp.]